MMRRKRRNPKPIITTMRLTNKYHENGGEWYLDYDDKKMMARIKKDLADAQREEPNWDWHLETRGTISTWHRMKDNPRTKRKASTKRILRAWMRAKSGKGSMALHKKAANRMGLKASMFIRKNRGHRRSKR